MPSLEDFLALGYAACVLRLTAIVVRRGLLALGVAVLLWLPISFWFWTSIYSMYPIKGIGVMISEGSFNVNLYEQAGFIEDWGIVISKRPQDAPREFAHCLLPDWSIAEPPYVRHWVGIPLWIVAALCLAWPVASLVIHRRRLPRGFPVEPPQDARSVNISSADRSVKRVLVC